MRKKLLTWVLNWMYLILDLVPDPSSNPFHKQSSTWRPENYATQIFITPLAFYKLQSYVAIAHGEIAGLGIAEPYRKKDFLIEDILLFDQQASMSSADISADTIMNFLFQARSSGVDLGSVKLWWHSHVDMPVYWSGIDRPTIEQFHNAEWMISVVCNKEHHYLVRADVYSPLRTAADELDLVVLDDLKEEFVPPEGLYQILEAEVKQKVSYRHNPTFRWGEEDEMEYFEDDIEMAGSFLEEVPGERPIG